jgi:hypothetical protein
MLLSTARGHHPRQSGLAPPTRAPPIRWWPPSRAPSWCIAEYFDHRGPPAAATSMLKAGGRVLYRCQQLVGGVDPVARERAGLAHEKASRASCPCRQVLVTMCQDIVDPQSADVLPDPPRRQAPRASRAPEREDGEPRPPPAQGRTVRTGVSPAAGTR